MIDIPFFPLWEQPLLVRVAVGAAIFLAVVAVGEAVRRWRQGGSK